MIDHARLRELEQDFGAEELQQILSSFLQEAGAAIGTLRDGWADPALRRERLHFLKGCAWTVGATRLGDLCHQLEARPDAGPDALRPIEREFQRVGESIERAGPRHTG